MFALARAPRSVGPAQAGLTMIELLIAMAIFAFLLALGVPTMTNWVLQSKAASAGEFYGDGFGTARRQAVSRNAVSRIVLTPNVNNGQMDYQIDVCYPTPGTPCNPQSGAWSTPEAPAANDPMGTAGYLSLFNSAGTLPQSDVLVPTIEPDGANAVYFTPLGWVDASAGTRLSRIRLDPAARYQGQIPPVALVVTLAGMASKCNPTIAAPDSRACPP